METTIKTSFNFEALEAPLWSKKPKNVNSLLSNPLIAKAVITAFAPGITS
jgi:hypothetical protein